jgi:hypothetical protein
LFLIISISLGIGLRIVGWVRGFLLGIFTWNWRSLISGKYGDRRQEFVVIAKNLNKDLMIENLEKCLLTESELELEAEGWKTFNDPFPEWQII